MAYTEEEKKVIDQGMIKDPKTGWTHEYFVHQDHDGYVIEIPILPIKTK